MEFSKLRKEYEREGIAESHLAAEPLPVFQDWMHQAIRHSPGDWFEPNAMTLATSDRSGQVTSRIVLLKEVRDGALVFFTNYLSEKGRQLDANPRASLCFHWPYLDRQICVEGEVRRSPESVSDAYFQSRPRLAQIGASASAQSTPLANRRELEQRFRELETALDGQPIPRPTHWGGFEVVPLHVEFWQGRADRLHDRIVYHRDGVTAPWTHGRLSP